MNMKPTMRPTCGITGLVTLATLAMAAPAGAVSLRAVGPAETIPDRGVIPVVLPFTENLTAGSATLAPLMAADVPTNSGSRSEASAQTGGGNVGKPLDDISFVARATDSGRKEINAAREALPQLQSPDLKRMADMLVTDHGKANARLAKIAEAKSWPVPAPPRHEPPPAGTAVPDFDAQWTADMIAAHERSVALYSAQAQGGEDPELRQYARETLPTIQHHLAELRRLQK
jgi:putative membrane protein